MRVEKNGPRYFSFQELPGANKSKKRHNYTNDEGRAKFAGKCRVCGGLLTWVEGTNVMACKNPDCKGLKRKPVEHDDGTVEYFKPLPVFRSLDEKGMQIAESLFEVQG